MKETLRSFRHIFHHTSRRIFRRIFRLIFHHHLHPGAPVAYLAAKDPVLAQNVQTQCNLLAVAVLVTINFMHVRQVGAHLAIALQYCYTVLAQHVYSSLGEL